MAVKDQHIGVPEKLLSQCEEFFQVFSPPEDLSTTVQHAREFITRHTELQRPVALVTVRVNGK